MREKHTHEVNGERCIEMVYWEGALIWSLGTDMTAVMQELASLLEERVEILALVAVGDASKDVRLRSR
jgi:hypothetical protein